MMSQGYTLTTIGTVTSHDRYHYNGGSIIRTEGVIVFD